MKLSKLQRSALDSFPGLGVSLPRRETLEGIEGNCGAKLAWTWSDTGMSRKIKTLLRRDKERYVRDLAKDVEGYLNRNDFRPAFRALKKLRSKSTSQTNTIRTTGDGQIDANVVRARWELYTAEPPN